MVVLHNNIKQILANKKWSIRKLSKELQKDYGQIHRLVNRESLDDTRLKTVVEIADKLDVTIGDLIW